MSQPDDYPCSFCDTTFQTPAERWEHTSSCGEMKQAMRDLRISAGLDEEAAE